MTAPNYPALLNQIRAERIEELTRAAASIAQWSADVDRAVAICSEDCDPAVHFAAQTIANTPHQLGEHEMAVLVGAVFRAIHRDGLNRSETRRKVLAALSDAVDDLLGEVVLQREGRCAA